MAKKNGFRKETDICHLNPRRKNLQIDLVSLFFPNMGGMTVSRHTLTAYGP